MEEQQAGGLYKPVRPADASAAPRHSVLGASPSGAHRGTRVARPVRGLTRGFLAAGLDALAHKKREEALASGKGFPRPSPRPPLASFASALHDEEQEEFGAAGSSGAQRAEPRRYRRADAETPSAPGASTRARPRMMQGRSRVFYFSGGVNEHAAADIKRRMEGQQSRGLASSSAPSSGGQAAPVWQRRPRPIGGDEWEETPQRARAGDATPLREPTGGRPLWDFEAATAPSARSGAAPATGASGYARPGSSRPRFVVEASPASGAGRGSASRAVRAPSALDGLDEDAGRLSPTAAFGDAEPDLAEQRAVDRQWYDDDEGGGHGEAFNPFAGDDSSYVKREVEMQKRLTRRDGSMMTLAQSKRHNQMHMDHTAWEENRLMTSGVARLREADMVRSGCLISRSA
jgi:hypothetical protein